MITVNALANALPINGRQTGEISDQFDIAFTPAGYVFSIWGLIYLSLTIFSVAQAMPSLRDDPELGKLRSWYLLNTAANSSWIFAWHYEQFVLSLLLMITILITLIVIYRKLTSALLEGRLKRWAIRLPFSLYLGWISLATIANTTVVLHTMGLQELLRSPIFTLALIATACGVCARVVLRCADLAFAGVYVWAIAGIGVANSGSPLLRDGAYALSGLCLILVVLARKRRLALMADAA